MGEIWSIYGAAFVNGVLFVAVVLRHRSLARQHCPEGFQHRRHLLGFRLRGDRLDLLSDERRRPAARDRSLLILATLWGGRLGLYIGARNWGGEDRRYARLRQHITDQGRNYVLYSLRAVFAYQGVAMVICTLPLLVAIVTPGNGQLGRARDNRGCRHRSRHPDRDDRGLADGAIPQEPDTGKAK